MVLWKKGLNGCLMICLNLVNSYLFPLPCGAGVVLQTFPLADLPPEGLMLQTFPRKICNIAEGKVCNIADLPPSIADVPRGKSATLQTFPHFCKVPDSHFQIYRKKI